MTYTLKDDIVRNLAEMDRGLFIPTSELIAVVASDLSNARSRVWTELRKLLAAKRVVKMHIRVPTDLKPRKRKNYKGNIPKETKPVVAWALTSRVPHEVFEKIHKTTPASESRLPANKNDSSKAKKGTHSRKTTSSSSP